jgi:hypothetical protein
VINGEEATRIAKAAAAAASKHDKHAAAAIFDMELQFYSGTNLLSTIHLQDKSFVAEGRGQFSDDSGVLKTLYKRLEKQAEKH